MPTEYAVIVHRIAEDWAGRRWASAVVLGTIHLYYPSEFRYRAWTAQGAKRRGERVIRSIRRQEADRARRDAIARRVTGYEDEKR